jgi:Flp pilus assembly protein TadG
MTCRVRNERGSMALELVLLTPALIGCILMIAAGARIVDARGQTTDAAFAAARAASLTISQAAAVEAGEQAATRSLTERGPACATLTVHIDAGAFQPGGHVKVTITCLADLADLTGFGLPGRKAFTATATVPLERHRDFS